MAKIFKVVTKHKTYMVVADSFSIYSKEAYFYTGQKQYPEHAVAWFTNVSSIYWIQNNTGEPCYETSE